MLFNLIAGAFGFILSGHSFGKFTQTEGWFHLGVCAVEIGGGIYFTTAAIGGSC